MPTLSINLAVALCLLTLLHNSLSIHTSQEKRILNQPFRTVKFIDNSVFFTLNSGRAFGYINITSRGQTELIYELDEDQRIMDEFSLGQKLIIGNKNKSLIYFEPLSRTIQWDNRFANQDFSQLKSFKQVSDRGYVITQDSIKLYKMQNQKWTFVKDLIAQKDLNPGIQESYHDLYYFPTKKFPQRVFALTIAVLQLQEHQLDGKKYISCFKWFQGQNQDVDGGCTYEDEIDIKDFRITGRYAYMRMGDQTYVYDQNLKAKTKWQQLPTQYVAGHAVTSDHLTYLFKTNQLTYYRLVQNFNNDDIKMTISGKSIFISKKNKRIIKLNNVENAEVIGSWLLQIDQNTFQVLIQFNSGDLHCYKIVKSQASTQINYLFRLAPEVVVNQQKGNQQPEDTQNDQNQAQQQKSNEQTIDPVPVPAQQMDKPKQEQDNKDNEKDEKQSQSSQSTNQSQL